MNTVLRESSRPSRRPRRTLARALVRSAVVHAYAGTHNLTAHTAAGRLFPVDDALRGYLSVQKAAVDPALTSVPEWAGALARETWGEFLSLLPASVYAQLAQLGVSATFENGKARFPARGSTASLAGDFVGENQPIAVKKGAVSAPALVPKRIAVITAYSREMDTASGSTMERFLRTAIAEDTAPAIDAKLLDASPATPVRPAGLLYGVTLTPSAGTTPADMAMDIKAAVAPILLAGGGRRVALLMNSLQALTLSLSTVWTDALRKAVVEIIASPHVPVGTLIALDAADFATAADVAPQFLLSSEATLHMSDTPETITDTMMASPAMSLFQQDSVALRMVQQMDWTMRRPGMVGGVTGIEW